jgi:hypothetical protein
MGARRTKFCGLVFWGKTKPPHGRSGGGFEHWLLQQHCVFAGAHTTTYGDDQSADCIDPKLLI